MGHDGDGDDGGGIARDGGRGRVREVCVGGMDAVVRVDLSVAVSSGGGGGGR